MYNLSSNSPGFSCDYSGCCSKFYSNTSNTGIEKIVYSMTDTMSCNNDYSNDFSSSSSFLKVYDFSEKYEDNKKDDSVMNTSAGIGSSYIIGQNNFNPLSFLNPERPKARFIIDIDELLPIVSEAFEVLIEESFPDNISIFVCDEDKMKKVHEKNGGVWLNSIQGFSINRNGKGVNEIFIKKDELDSMMLTIGHEIGHVMTNCLKNSVDEEAKAFAFSLAWINVIREYNIGDLAPNISPNPAKNGLHDKAFNFVVSYINKGIPALEVFRKISIGDIKFKNF
jgi:hypothetical protein